MNYSAPARTTIYRSRSRIRMRRFLAAGLLILIAAIGAPLVHRLPESSSSTTAASPIDSPRGEYRRAPGSGPPGAPPGALGEADGAISDGATVFDDGFPGVAKLDPGLLMALREAATDAGSDGVDFLVTSGWRSPQYQERLLQEAVSEYGSEQEAARWVASPETSPHVAGDGVDLGSDASTWLSENGARYGLCQIYGNEPWHYEMRPEAVDQGCPDMYDDHTHDPRMQ
jgi:hypothetical protein